MGREQNIIVIKSESNLIVECNKVMKKFYPELFNIFA